MNYFPKILRVLIVDDEPIACRFIERILNKDPQIEIIGSCCNPYDALRCIREDAPDIVFLDIQMPEMNAFEMLQNLDPEELPFIVFVTAYDRYALKAFEVHALDYLLKPFDEERMQQTVQRAKRQILIKERVHFSERMLAFLDSYNSGVPVTKESTEEPPYLEKISVKFGRQLIVLETEEIDWIEAADNYVLLHTGKHSHLVRLTMQQMQSKLDPRIFFRTHRSHIVNLKRIAEVRPRDYGDCTVVLRDGTSIRISRSRKAALQAALRQIAP